MIRIEQGENATVITPPPVARESKRTIAKVSAPVPLVMGQVMRFYVVALRC